MNYSPMDIVVSDFWDKTEFKKPLRKVIGSKRARGGKGSGRAGSGEVLPNVKTSIGAGGGITLPKIPEKPRDNILAWDENRVNRNAKNQ